VPLRAVRAAREELRGGRRGRFPAGRALQLAGEVLAVSAGLKPALLYDCGAAGPAELRRYAGRLRAAGLAPGPLHALGLGGSALLLQPGLARRRLRAALRADPAPFVDVSAARRHPRLCGREEAEAIRGHLAALLGHLRATGACPCTPAQRGASQPSPSSPGAPSLASSAPASSSPGASIPATSSSAASIPASEVVPAGWNLCTIFGVLLGYPVAYTFSVEEGDENCLAMTPLRVFTVQAACPRIKDGLVVQIYSFSVPESLCVELKEVLDAWCEELKEAFSTQSDFVDLCISSKVVSLPAVAL
ncbi:CA074 protein, partial [Centropus unirufus]|nr:CA074 protein [Centropus unirufus]